MDNKRTLKVIFNKRSNGYYTTKLSLPISDFKKMGIDIENREVFYEFDEENKKMIISSKAHKAPLSMGFSRQEY